MRHYAATVAIASGLRSLLPGSGISTFRAGSGRQLPVLKVAGQLTDIWVPVQLAALPGGHQGSVGPGIGRSLGALGGPGFWLDGR
jgi:hypothetical protein